MFYGNSRSRIVHYQQCGYARRSKNCGSARLREFYTIDEAKTQGYRMCKCCDPVKKRFKAEEEEIRRFCNENNMFYRLSNGEMEIITPESHWKAAVGNGSKIQLYHQNRAGNKYERRLYHVQKYNVTTAMPMLRYIVKHDTYTLSKEEARPKKKKKKGSKGYAAQMKRQKAHQKRRSIKYVLDLIDAVSAV